MRDRALEVLKKYVKNEKMLRHCIATGAIMRGVAKELGEDEQLWEVLGILHDVDYELVKGDMERHGELGAEILEREGFGFLSDFVRRHNHMKYENYEKPIEVALQAADSASGLIIACALVKSGKITEVTTKTVKKKFKEKSFAPGSDRNRIKMIESLMPLERFYEVAINSLVEVREELGLE